MEGPAGAGDRRAWEKAQPRPRGPLLWLGSARLGPARPGSVRFGSARLHLVAQICSAAERP